MSISNACYEADIHVDFMVTEGESLVTRARNNLVATFMSLDYDVLAFIDADIKMEGADFVKLCRIEGVRGAAVNMKMAGHPECLSAYKDGKQLKREDMPSKPFPVDYLGAAVFLLDKKKLETLYGFHVEQKGYIDPIVGQGVALFETSINNNTYMSEDYSFCDLCKDAGIDVICDPSVIVEHYGQSVWTA